MRKLSEASGVQELIDGLTYQILLVDADYRIHAYNKSTAKAFGKALTTEVLQHCYAVVYPSENPHSYCPMPKVLKTGREAHKMVRAPDGAWNRISIYPTDLTTEAGDRLYLHTVRDASQIMKDSLELVLQDELLNRVGESIFVIDKSGAIRYANRAAYKGRGYTEEEFLKLNIKDVNLPERAEFVDERIEKVWKKGRATFENICLRKDGSTFPVEINAKKFQFANLDGMISVARDITERKRAEEALRKKEAMKNFGMLADNAHDGVLVLSGDKGKIVYANRRIARITGYTRSELVSIDTREILRPVEIKSLKDRYQKRLAGKSGPRTYESFVVNKHGENVPIEVSVSKTSWSGQPAIVAIFRDISDRKKTEELLREKQIMENFKLLVGNTNDGVMVVWGKGEFAYANESMARITGYSVGELTSMHFEELVHPDEIKSIREIFRKRIAGVAIPQTHETIMVKKNGKSLPIEVTGSKTVWQGKPATVVTYRDISRRKAMEDTLGKQYALLNAMLESNTGPVFSIDTEGRYTSFNTAHVLAMKNGYGANIELGKKIFDYMTVAKDRKKGEGVFRRVLRGETISEDTSYGDEKRNRYDFNLIYAPIKDKSGKIIGGSVFSRDITEQKRIEQELQEKRAMENFKSLADNANDAVLIILGKEQRYVYANRRAAELTGYTVEEILEIGLDEIVHPDDRELVRDRFRKRLTGERVPITYEVRIAKKNGEPVPIEVTGAITSWFGQPAGINIIRDIRDRKQTEAAIQEKKVMENFKLLVGNSNDGVLVTSIKGEYVYANKRIARMTGYSIDELTSMHFKKLIHPDETERIREVFAKRLAGESIPQTHKTVFVKKTGEALPVEVTGAKTVWQGKPATAITVRDMTDRKIAEETIKRERDAAQNYLDIAEVIIVAINAGGKVAMINRFGADLLGCPVESIVGKDWFANFLPPDERESVRAVFDRITQGDISDVETVQNSVLRSDGTERLIRWHNKYVKDKDGKLLFTLSSGEDVTEAVETQAKLGKSYARMEHVVDGIIGALATTVETRDPYTANHQRRVAQLSVAIAGKLGWGIEDQKVLENAAMIHDIGKMYVPAEVLNKPGKLDSIEFELIKLHSASAYEILENIDFAGPVAAMVRQHHERLDGSGYPDGLRDKQIEPGAKIMAVADVVEAMASDRPYRPSCGLDAALKEVQDRKGELYDKKAVDACIALFKKDHFSFD